MTTPLEDFEALLREPRDALPLLALAAQVPRYAEDGFAPDDVVRQVHAWAGQLVARVAADASAVARLRLLNRFFFAELGFRGAREDYDSPLNSYLHRVIERRRGIPITLSLLYAEIGRALGLRLQGVSFPGHFLVRMTLNAGAVFIDVFDGGRSLSLDELRGRLRASMPEQTDVAVEPFLRPAGEREVLARLLRNLKRAHSEAGQWQPALEVAHRLVAVLPHAAQERLDRARIYEQLECPRAAAADLRAALAAVDSPADAEALRPWLARLQQDADRLN